MSDEISKRLSTYALLGRLMNESLKKEPPPAALELTWDGWQVWDGESFDPTPVHADLAWEIAEKSEPGGGEMVLAKTRQLCGDLRIAAKRRGVSPSKRSEYEQTLSDLRAGLARVREAKSA